MFSRNPLINLLRYSWHYSFGMKKWYVFFVVFSALGNIVWLMQPIVIGKIFNNIQFAQGENQVHYVAYGVGLLILINVVGWIFHGTSRVVENKNAFLLRKNYRQEMFERVMELPTSWHKDHHSGDTIDKVNKASDHLFSFSSESFIIIQNIVGLVASIIILAIYDLKLVLAALVFSLIAIAVIIKFDKKLLKNYKTIYKAENFISSGVYDYISNYVTIISLRLKERATREIEDRSMKPFPVFVNNSKLNELKWFLSSLTISIMTAVILLWNAHNTYTAQGVIVIGTLFIVYQYLNSIGQAFYTFAWKYGDIVQQNAAVVAAEVIQDEYAKLHLGKRFVLPDGWKVLQIKKLFFTYKENVGGEEKNRTLSDISFSLERGKKIALIGTSGSGKSTLLSLLRGLHETENVSVYCDGKKMKDGLRHLHGYGTLIPQEPEIFNNTIEYNITMGVRVAQKKIAEVVEAANLQDLIARLEKGLQTNVQEKGVSLSGGEKQRLALARGILAAQDSQFLLLDEPTSSVDVENELRIYQNIFKVFNERVIVSAIHSLHLLKYFDYVYMFKDGKIVSEGSFVRLLEDENFKILWKNYDMERENKA